MRGIILVILSIIITGAAAFFVFYRNTVFEGKEQGASVGGLPKTTPLSEIGDFGGSAAPATAGASPAPPEGAGRDPEILTDSIQTADKYLAEALPLIEPKDRFAVIEKISSFNDYYKLAINRTGSDPVRLDILMRATARYIAAWSPFYYYIHGDAQAVLGRTIKMLERERAAMLKELAKQDARKAGKLAAEDIEYYIEDIRKSAARRNSDFITFSLQDYEKYRKNFDELAQPHKEFLFGFAERAYILVDDFYRMHEEVDLEYVDKTRKKVEDVRLELRGLHNQALLGLEDADDAAARTALAKTISTIESELALHSDWHGELHDIMKSDYEFYKSIKL